MLLGCLEVSGIIFFFLHVYVYLISGIIFHLLHADVYQWHLLFMPCIAMMKRGITAFPF